MGVHPLTLCVLCGLGEVLWQCGSFLWGCPALVYLQWELCPYSLQLSSDSVCDFHGQNLQVQPMSRENLVCFIGPWPPAHTGGSLQQSAKQLEWKSTPLLKSEVLCQRMVRKMPPFGLGASSCPKWRSTIKTKPACLIKLRCTRERF